MYYRLSWLSADGTRYTADYETAEELERDRTYIERNGGSQFDSVEVTGNLLPK